MLKIDKKQRIKLIVDRITPTKNIFNLHINIIRIFLWDIRIFIKGKNVLFSYKLVPKRASPKGCWIVHGWV